MVSGEEVRAAPATGAAASAAPIAFQHVSKRCPGRGQTAVTDLNFAFKSLALGLQDQALDSGAINAADVLTTDPQLASGKYVVLTDPKHIFGFQNVALVINTKKLASSAARRS